MRCLLLHNSSLSVIYPLCIQCHAISKQKVSCDSDLPEGVKVQRWVQVCGQYYYASRASASGGALRMWRFRSAMSARASKPIDMINTVGMALMVWSNTPVTARPNG